jgi:hypothetical protein
MSPQMQIPMRDARVEKMEFRGFWDQTIQLFANVVKMIKKGKTEKAMVKLFTEIKQLDAMIDKLERKERNTVTYLTRHIHLFEPLFDNNYGKGYFEKEVMRNYEVRFRILEILKYEYELVRYLLSETL